MAVYKIFPYKDTTLYSFYPNMNTGIDPISQISNLNFAVDTNPQAARFLTEFVQEEIEDVMHSIMSGEASKDDIAEFLLALRAKGPTIDEITGAAKIMRKFVVGIDTHQGTVLDT